LSILLFYYFLIRRKAVFFVYLKLRTKFKKPNIMKKTSLMFFKQITTPFTVLFLLIFNVSCNQAQENQSSFSEETIKNYQNYCAGCHGDNFQRFDKKEWLHASQSNQAFEAIKYGKKEIGMPAFEESLSDEEIKAMADYIRAKVSQVETDGEAAFKSGQVIQSEKQKFILDTIAVGLDVPWGMEFLPNGDLLISERSGILYRFSKGELIEIKGLPDIMAKGQGGLMDLHLHPDYEKNGWLYFAFSDPSEKDSRKGCTAVMRAKIEDDRLTNKELIFDGEPNSSKGYHWGCKLEFDNDGYLWFGIGDRGERDVNPQTLENDCGKIHRIHDDGRIPEDNPFTDKPEAMPSIYSYGHRNPQGTHMHPETGDIWISEHGPKGGDELNLIKAGANYGWPVVSYGINYNGTKFTELTHKEGMEQPVTYWDPSIAPCGMTFVTGDRYPKWKNNILLGSLSFEHLERVELKGNEVVGKEQLLEGIGRVRNVVMSPDNYIYIAVEKPGVILKLVPLN
jgi:glucose/arabinose dehydrogenase